MRSCLSQSVNSFFKNCLFPRDDVGSSPLHGSHSQTFCQEPSVFPEDTLQSAERRQTGKEEKVTDGNRKKRLLQEMLNGNKRFTLTEQQRMHYVKYLEKM